MTMVPEIPVIRYNHPFVKKISSAKLTKPLYREIVTQTTNRIMRIIPSRIFESVYQDFKPLYLLISWPIIQNAVANNTLLTRHGTSIGENTSVIQKARNGRRTTSGHRTLGS
jgi:hypothetical protein